MRGIIHPLGSCPFSGFGPSGHRLGGVRLLARDDMATFVRLAAEPVTAGRFSGRIEHVPVGDLELSTMVAGSQHVRRTRSLIAQGNEEYLLASIQQRGSLRPSRP